MTVAGATGALHVAMTVTLGLLFAWGERKVLHAEDLERVGGWTLIAIGALYLFLHLAHGGHHHEREASASDRVALAALVFAVTASPCSLSSPILVTAAATSVAQVVLITLVLLFATVRNMLLPVGLT